MPLTRITGNLLNDGSVGSTKIADGIITSQKIADGTIRGTDLNFPGVTYQIRSAFYNTQFSMSPGIMYDLNVTISITPTVNNSKFLIMGYGHADDNSSTSWGIGLAIMCDVSGYGNRYYSLQGSHHNYVSGAADHYFHANITEIDDGSGHEGGSIPVVAGVPRTYRLYGCCHNDSCRWNANNISQNAATMSRSPGSSNTYGTRLVIIEFAG
jgi:hypothetical protein